MRRGGIRRGSGDPGDPGDQVEGTRTREVEQARAKERAMATESENASVLTPRPPKPGKKYFSVDEANRALPYISRIVEDLRGPYSRLMEISRRLENLAA